MFATAGQARIFIATVVAGLGVGFLYDALSVLRRVTRNDSSVTSVLDFVFWIAAAIALTYVMVFAGGEGLRGYMLLGFAAGLLIYLVGVHRAVVFVLNKLTAFTQSIRRRFVRLGRIDG